MQYHILYFSERKGKTKVQGVPQSQSQATALPRHQEETNKMKQAQIEQTIRKALRLALSETQLDTNFPTKYLILY